MGTLIAARVWHPGDWFGYQRLARAFRRGQGRWPGYRRLGTPVLDVFTGELEDWQHHVKRCWGVCVECFSWPETLAQHWSAPTPFWRFNPPRPRPDRRPRRSGRARPAHRRPVAPPGPRRGRVRRPVRTAAW